MRVEEFYNNSEKLTSIREILKDVYDINRIIARLSNFKANPKDILNLGISLSVMSDMKEQLKSLPALFKLISTSYDLTKMIDKIESIINNDLPANFKNGGVIKNGFSAQLDELRKISTEANDMLVKIQIKEQKKTGIPSLKIGYNRVFGYYFEVTKVHLNKIPKHYIRKQTLTNSERFFTSELKEYENKILSASEGILELEKEIFEELCLEILTKAKEIQYNASLISTVDIASSLAFLALQNDYSSPKITNGSELILENARHPVVETLLEVEKEFIPNELSLDCKKNQIAIITGPNMAGKSTYLRQTGIIVLMAQIGSFVPASKAIIGVVDKLFTRVGASDNLAAGESTFLVEMNETSNILNNSTNRSLIILDEIGRGTSTYDGLSIAWAVTEYIHNKKEISAKTLFATHYHELVDLIIK